jgi:hypothetical protein
MWSMSTHAPVVSMSREPQKLMDEAQHLYRTTVWVNAAERAINSRLSRAPVHLERPDGETVWSTTTKAEVQPTPGELAIIDLIQVPNREQKRVSNWRGLTGLSSRHSGLCGNAFWVLDQLDALSGTPLGVLYVNPVRMSEATDGNGNLLGWVIDHPRNPVTGRPGFAGIPIRLDEVEHLVYDEPDAGHFGIGIAEAAYTKIELSRLADSHAAGVLASGGRIAGLMSPKSANEVNADEWEATIRTWRQIVDDPESAKRLHIVRGPVDFTPTAAKPAEMELHSLATMSRQDVFAAWHVPESQVGIHGASGLNSGEHIKFEEAALWQGPIEDRVTIIREAWQRILDRFKALGTELTLVIETPSFDDEQPLYENADKAKVVPLTVNQRLEMVGKDPLDEKLYGSFGDAIFIDQGMVRVDPLAPPEPEPPPVVAPLPPLVPEEVEAKAALDDELRSLRTKIEQRSVPVLRASLAEVWDEMRSDISGRTERFREHLAANPFDASVWFDEPRWTSRINAALLPAAEVSAEVATAQSARFRAQAESKADEWIERVAQYVRAKSLNRVTGMLRTVRESVQKAITEGIREHLTAGELAARVQAAAGLDEYRAELIARTEVISAYNDASLRTFSEFGAERVQANDGDEDAECAARNGAIYSISEAAGITDHPNGTLDWSPVV